MYERNQLKLGVILSYMATGLNMLVYLVYTPLMIRLLGKSEYGLYTLVGSVVSYLSLFSLGFTGAYLRFYSRYEKEKKKESVARLNGMFLVLFCAMSVAAFVCGMILSQYTHELFGKNLTVEELEKAKVLMQILVVNIALTFPASLFDSFLSAHEQFLFQRIVSLLGIIFNPLISLPLLFMGYGSVAIVSVTTGITILKLAVNIWFCKKKIGISFIFHGFEFRLLGEIANFSFFLFLNMIIDQINWSVDKFILGRVSGTGAVAVYGVGAQINSLYMLFSTGISSVFAPRINRIAAQKTKTMEQEFTGLFIKVGRIQFLVLALLASGITFFGEYFITQIYATAEYTDAYAVALLLILPATVPLIQNLGIEIQRAVNKHQFRSIVYLIMAVVNIGMSIPLAMIFGPTGAAAATAISLLVANGLIMNFYYARKLGIDIAAFWKSIGSMGKGMIVPVILGSIIMQVVCIENIGSFLFWVFLYTVIYVFSMWMWGMNQDEKELILAPARKLRNRSKK